MARINLRGTVNPQKRAILPLTVTGPNGRTADIGALVDTGFNGDLVLPRSVVDHLGLSLRGGQLVTVADGHAVWMDIYRATILWKGESRTVYALVAGNVALLGTGLLYGNRLTVHWLDGGEVLIETL